MFLTSFSGWSRNAYLFAALVLCTKPCLSQVATNSDPQSHYTALLSRLKGGDISIDFREFRLSAALSVARGSARQEFATDSTARKLLAEGHFQAALDVADEMLKNNYASLFGHLNAMLASQKLNKTEEAAYHEKLLKALADSISASGDGKSLATAWFVVTVPEEHYLLREIYHIRPAKQFLIFQDGHAYDRIEAVDPQTQEAKSFWFNTDVDMNIFKPGEKATTEKQPTPSAGSGQTAATLTTTAAPVLSVQPQAGPFSLVQQPAGIWGLIWNLRGSYEVTTKEVVIRIEAGTAKLKDVLPPGWSPVHLNQLQLGICSRPDQENWTMYPKQGLGTFVVPLNGFMLDKNETYNFSAAAVRIPLPDRNLPAANWLCGQLSAIMQNSKEGFYPAHNEGRPVLLRNVRNEEF